MRLIRCVIPAICIILLMALTGCYDSLPSPVLCTLVDRQGRPLNEASVFSVDTPRIFCSINRGGLSDHAVIIADWTHYDGVLWRALKSESLMVDGSDFLVFAVESPLIGWETGQYRVSLRIDDRVLAEKLFTVAVDGQVPLPVVNSFNVTPSTTYAGQQFTLSWNVSGATRVIIDPDIGSVEAGGSRLMVASADITYVLTAMNRGGSTSVATSLRVLKPSAGTARIAIIDIFREVGMVYYKVRNSGDAVSTPASAILYVDGTRLASDYIAPLEPGQERIEVFGTFNWTYRLDTPAMVCIVSDDQNTRSGEENCLIKLLPGVRAL